MLAEFESVAKRLQADFEETQAIAHRGLKGDARENAVAGEMLRRFLPRRFSVAGGVIVDSLGGQSQQQDLVIYDALTSPTLQDHDDNQVFFVEQVAVTIEVKSSLDRPALYDIVEKGGSVAALTSKPQEVMQLATGIESGPSGCPSISCGFAYESPRDIYDICGILNERAEQTKIVRRPSTIVVLRDSKGRPGLIVNTKPEELGTITVVPGDDCQFAVVKAETQGQALLYFYLILMERLQFDGVLPPRPDFRAYAAAAGLPRPMTAVMWRAAKRARFSPNGKPVDPELLTSLYSLGTRIASKKAVTDDEIIQLFAEFSLMEEIDPFREGAVFVVSGQVWTELTPAAVGAALAAWRRGATGELHERILARFVGIVREVVDASAILYIFNHSMSVMFMCFSAGKPVRLGDKDYTIFMGTFVIESRSPIAGE